MPAERVSGIPFGLGFTKPNNYWEVVRTAWQHKRNPLFTWRILRDGGCDGWAVGPTGLKDTIGVAASTCSYTDWIGSHLIVFFGSDVPNNQPVTTKYLYYAKKQGTKIAVVNPMREPGLERYWVPSVPGSALFGTQFADEFFTIHTGEIGRASCRERVERWG